ncbi:DUF819 domain-containing protein [Skeletonema marinoi]|uniref:DUF819 domain-containing protein n=1 Tax=Skeletonema marinoi TaxID=267567 RepID=A0AAD8YAZ9_9STRA|nr:DUF819 domain-containing protein [Skeletonema marinoi]
MSPATKKSCCHHISQKRRPRLCLALAIGTYLSCHQANAFSLPLSTSLSKKLNTMPSQSLNIKFVSTMPSSSSTALYATPSPSLISSSNHWGNVAALSFTASLAQLLGKKTLVGKLLGAPVTAMAVAFVLSSVGFIPSLLSTSATTTGWMTLLAPGGSPSSSFLQNISLTLATPLLLLGTSLRGNALRQCGSLLGSFFIASFGTLAGAMIAFSINTIPRALLASVPNQDGLKIAAALLAKNIGGGINYMAVCSCLNASPESVAAGLCVDNVMALVYFPLVSVLASKYKDVVDDDDDDGLIEKKENDESNEKNDSSSELSPVESLSHAFTLAAVLTAGGQFINSKLHYVTTSPLNLSLPITTLLTVIFSTYYPPNMFLSPTSTKKRSDEAKSNSIAKAGETLGTSLLYLFFATAGAPGWRLKESIQQSFPSIATFLIILYGVHGSVLWSLKKLVEVTKMDKSKYWKKVIAPQRLLTASSAAIGGPATAAALAQSNQWESLLTPSLLVGNVGYALATFIGLLFYGAVKKSLL